MTDLLNEYLDIAGSDVVRQLRHLAEPLKGKRVLHVNSTKEGGGVAEILHKLIPLKQSLGIDAKWLVIQGDPDFYSCTKAFHNALQGVHTSPGERLLKNYERINAAFAGENKDELESADFVFIHDPQPAAAILHFPNRRGKWIWRCHIDISRPFRPVWRYLYEKVVSYDASIYSLPQFSRRLPHSQYIIPPSIDPLSEKNMELSTDEVNGVIKEFAIDPERPVVLQVSRFDRFKDPVGVIEASRLARKFAPLQLILAGGGASDDPEGEAVLKEVREAAAGDPDISILLLPPDAHRSINALQRVADIVLQKSLKEGFGLTVAEAMWKGKPVIGGDVGGIRLQIINHYTGFLVSTPEGAALRMRYLLHRRDRLEEMGQRAHRHIRENFLLTRHLRDYLALMLGIQNSATDRLLVGVEHD